MWNEVYNLQDFVSLTRLNFILNFSIGFFRTKCHQERKTFEKLYIKFQLGRKISLAWFLWRLQHFLDLGECAFWDTFKTRTLFFYQDKKILSAQAIFFIVLMVNYAICMNWKWVLLPFDWNVPYPLFICTWSFEILQFEISSLINWRMSTSSADR